MRPLTIYSFLVAALCFAGVGFTAAFLTPKISILLRELDSPFPLMSDSYRSFIWDKRGFYLSMVGLGIALAGCLAALVPGLWKRFGGKLVAIMGVALSLGALGWLAWESATLNMGATDVIFAGDRKTQSYRRVLEEFTLVEAAEGRIAATNESIRRLFNSTPERITDVSKLPRVYAESRLDDLLRPILSNESPGIQKQALATMPLFATLLPDGNRKSKQLIEAANRITGQKFEKIAELFEWVKQQEGNGYIPIPLFQITPPVQSVQGAP